MVRDGMLKLTQDDRPEEITRSVCFPFRLVCFFSFFFFIAETSETLV